MTMPQASREEEPPRQPHSNADSPQEVEISLWSFGSALLRYRRWIVLLAVAFGVVAGLSALTAPRQYTASAKFAPQERSTSESSLGTLASQLGVGISRSTTNSPQFYSDLLVSREVLRDVVRAEYTVPGDKPFRGDLVAWFAITGADSADETSRAVTSVRGLINSLADRNGVVSVEFHSGSPALSLQIVNRLLLLVNEFNLSRRQSQARAERAFVEQQVDIARKELKAAEDALVAFFERNRVIQSPTAQAISQRLQREVSVRQQLFLSLSQSYESAKIEEVRNTPVVTVLERPEGFVRKEPRRVVQKAVLASLLGVVIAVLLAFVWEFGGRKSRDTSGGAYNEFSALRRDALNDLRRLFFLRPNPPA
ncbi:MAG: Wzz/FepE/Etk N-terminal domain-containing protein [Gemmatimonadaceae bacterium]